MIKGKIMAEILIVEDEIKLRQELKVFLNNNGFKTKEIIDFDDTLIHGDSGGKLLKYYLKKHPLSVFKLLKVVYHYALYLLKIEPLNKAKSA